MDKSEQLGFKGRGWPRKLTEREIEQRRQAGHAAAAKAGSLGMSQRGRKGYERAIERIPDFHQKGGLATAHIDAYTSSNGAVGLVAWINDGKPLKGKKHRYRNK